MAVKRKGLGRGLDGLFPNYAGKKKEESEKEEAKKNKIVKKAKEKIDLPIADNSSTEISNTDNSGTEISNAENSSAENVSRETYSEIRRDAASGTAEDVSSGQNNTKADSDTLEGSADPDVSRETLKNGVAMIRISDVEPNRDQPRKKFDEDALEELAESIRQYGVIQPLVVQKKNGMYQIVAGERRWRAAKLAGLKKVPAVIKNFTDQEVMEISLIENIQREDLNAIEEAQAYRQLLDEFHMTQDELAEKVSKSRTAITNSMRLLKLSEKVQEMLIDEKITSGHARALIAVEDPEAQLQLAEQVFDRKLSVRETERLVKEWQKGPTEKKPKEEENSALLLIYQEMETKMKEALGTKVTVSHKDNNKGKIEIEYYSQDDLERIYDLLRRA